MIASLHNCLLLTKMAQKYVNTKYILFLDDIQFYLHKRSCYIDQLQKLCEIEFQYGQYQSIQRKHPLFDCLIVVGLQKFAGSLKPFIKMKYPNSVLCIRSILAIVIF